MSSVYFVQPTNGGPIRVGATDNLALRMRSAAWANPNGIEVLTSIPGYFGREAVLHQLLKPLRLNASWYRSCPTLWRLVMEAMHGDLSWLPAELTKQEWTHLATDFRRRVEAAFDSPEALAALAGVNMVSLRAGMAKSGHKVSVVLYGALIARELEAAGALPDYLRAAA